MEKRDSVGSRLKIIMDQRKLKQIDVLNLAKPFFTNGIKISKTDLSQYVNNKTEPRSDQLNILSLALNVQPQWLLGYGNSEIIPSLDTLNKSKNHRLDYGDLGLPYKGTISEDLNDTFRLLAKQYAEKHNLPKRDA